MLSPSTVWRRWLPNALVVQAAAFQDLLDALIDSRFARLALFGSGEEQDVTALSTFKAFDGFELSFEFVVHAWL